MGTELIYFLCIHMYTCACTCMKIRCLSLYRSLPCFLETEFHRTQRLQTGLDWLPTGLMDHLVPPPSIGIAGGITDLSSNTQFFNVCVRYTISTLMLSGQGLDHYAIHSVEKSLSTMQNIGRLTLSPALQIDPNLLGVSHLPVPLRQHL